jgi:hypothetical protein
VQVGRDDPQLAATTSGSNDDLVLPPSTVMPVS